MEKHFVTLENSYYFASNGKMGKAVKNTLRKITKKPWSSEISYLFYRAKKVQMHFGTKL